MAATVTLDTTHNTVSKGTIYLLQQRALTFEGDTFQVKDQDGTRRFSIKSPGSFKEKKTISSDEGIELYTVQKKTMSRHQRRYIVDAKSGAKLAAMRLKKVSRTRTVVVHKGVKDEGDAWLECKGDILHNNFEITDACTGMKVAEAKKSFVHSKNSSKFGVTIEPGYDDALVLLIAAVTEEMCQDDACSGLGSVVLGGILLG